MCTYLAQRGSTYYFRRIIPVELRSALGGKREIIYSLKTKDRQAAKRLIPQHTIESDRLIDQAKAKMSKADDSLASIRTPDVMTWALSPKVHSAGCKANAEAVEASETSEHLVALREPRVPLLAAFDAYAASQNIKPSTRRDWRKMIERLVQFLGHEDAAAISKGDLIRWKDHLLNEVSKNGSKRDPRTVRGSYMVSIRVTLEWAVEQGKLTANVASAISVRLPKKAKLRERDFTSDEARKILAATLRLATSNIGSYETLAYRWIPWLCAYTGARVNEISQLRGNDVAKVEGIWAIRITPEAGTVKSNIARLVPIHSHLIEQGFLPVAEAAGNQPIFYDPNRQRDDRDGNRYYKKVGERLARWIRTESAIDDPYLQPNHGWRHTFKTLTRTIGLPQELADAVQGHAMRTVGATYGRFPLATLSEAIERIPRFSTENHAGIS